MLVTCQFTYLRHVTTTFDLKIVKINALLTHITVWYQPCNYYKTYVVTCGYFDNCLVKVVVTCLKYVNWYVNNMLPDYLLEISQRTLRYERTDGRMHRCHFYRTQFASRGSIYGNMWLLWQLFSKSCGNMSQICKLTCYQHVTNMLPDHLLEISQNEHMLPHVTTCYQLFLK